MYRPELVDAPFVTFAHFYDVEIKFFLFTHNIKCLHSIFKWYLVAFYYDIFVIYVTHRILLAH